MGRCGRCEAFVRRTRLEPSRAEPCERPAIFLLSSSGSAAGNDFARTKLALFAILKSRSSRCLEKNDDKAKKKNRRERRDKKRERKRREEGEGEKEGERKLLAGANVGKKRPRELC